jgi:hypothetical protein
MSATERRFRGWIINGIRLRRARVRAFATLLEDTLQPMKTPPIERAEQSIDRYYRDYLRSMNLEAGS